MQARVITFEGSPQSAQGAPQRFREEVLPKLRAQGGFRGALVLLDRESGKFLGVTLWDSDEDLKAAARSMDAVRDANTSAMGVSQRTEDFEVVAQMMEGSATGGS